MTTLVVGSNHEALMAWCEDKIGNGSVFTPETTRCVALLDEDNNYEPICVVAIDGWTAHNCEVSMAADGSRRWQNDEFVQAAYNYIFDICGKTRMSLVVRVDNHAANYCQERYGHTKEATMKDWFGEDEDAYLWAYTRKEWLAGKEASNQALNTTKV
jgi:ribosomal protein S18 acetylase RimI-like enzyme